MTATQPTTAHVDTPVPAPVLTPEQKARAKELEADRKEAEEKAKVLAEAHDQFQKDVAAAIAKRDKATEKYVDPSLNGIVEAAWNAVRDVTDPVFKDCILHHREKLTTHAESVIRTGLPEAPTDFEKKVAELLTKKEYKDLTPQGKTTWSESGARDEASDYEGGENEKGVLAKGAKSGSKDDKK